MATCPSLDARICALLAFVGVSMMAIATLVIVGEQRTQCLHSHRVTVGGAEPLTAAPAAAPSNCWTTFMSAEITGAHDETPVVVDWEWQAAFRQRPFMGRFADAWPNYLQLGGLCILGGVLAVSVGNVRRLPSFIVPAVVLMAGAICMYAGAVRMGIDTEPTCSLELTVSNGTSVNVTSACATQQQLRFTLTGSYPPEAPARVLATWTRVAHVRVRPQAAFVAVVGVGLAMAAAVHAFTVAVSTLMRVHKQQLMQLRSAV